jgi:Ca2+-binding RTX toxin-like protein
VGHLLVDVGDDNGRLFVDPGHVITLEDEATHVQVPCSYGDIPATPDNTTLIDVSGGFGGITFDGVGGMFGANTINTDVAPVSIIGTPQADTISVSCNSLCKYRNASMQFNAATIAIGSSSAGGPVSGAGGDDHISIDGHWRGSRFFSGGDGNDTLSIDTSGGRHGGGKEDFDLSGDAGNDSLTGGKHEDVLSGGPGDDTLKGGSGNDNVSGDEGNDQLFGEAHNDQLDGGPGNDKVDGGKGSDVMLGGTEDDTFFAVDGKPDSLDGGDGFDDAYIDKPRDTTVNIELIH